MCLEAFAIAAAARVIGGCFNNNDRGVEAAMDHRRRCDRDRGVESARENRRCERDHRRHEGVESEMFRRGIEPTMNIYNGCCREEKKCCRRCCD